MNQPLNLTTLFKTFFTVGAISFGGGMLAYLREYFVKRNNWLTEEEFLVALALSQTMPGLNGINLSVVIGDKKCGVLGAIVASLGLILPGTMVILILGTFYAHYSNNPHLNAFLIGVAATAIGFSFKNVIELGAVNLKCFRDGCFVIATFIAIGILHIHLFIVFLVLAPLAIWFNRPQSL